MRLNRSVVALLVGTLGSAAAVAIAPESEASTPAPAGRPDWAAVVAPDGGLEVLSTADGFTTHILAFHDHPSIDEEAEVTALALSPDRGTLYYTAGDFTSGSEVWRVATSGEAKPEFVARGAAPALSPDGRLLAYAVVGPGIRHSTIVVRDLHGGAERRIPPPPSGPESVYVLGDIDAMAFSPDGRRLAVATDWEGSYLRIIDVDSANSYDKAPDAELSAPVWLGDGALVAVGSCGYPEETCEADEVRSRLVTVDPATRELTPLPTPDGLVEATAMVRSAAVSPDGEHLLVARRDGSLDMVGPGGRLTRLGGGVTLAVW